jgi:hypothetical protein
MRVLSMAVTVAAYGARAVGVGEGVLVGGTSETRVGDGCKVIVGASVGVSEAKITVAVHVGSIWSGVIVAVGKSKGVGILGCSGFRGVSGVKKTYKRNAPMTRVTNSTRAVNRSRILNLDRRR